MLVHKFAPSLAVWVDMGRISEMVRLWNRLLNVSESVVFLRKWSRDMEYHIC